MPILVLLTTLFCAPLTVEQLAASPSLIGTAPASVTWSPDGARLAFLWNAEGLPARALHVVDRGGSVPRPLAPAVSSYVWSRDGRALFYLSPTGIHRVAASGGDSARLLAAAGEQSDLGLSPDGATLAFLQDGDLWLLPTAQASPRQATHLALPAIGAIPLGRYFHRDVEIGAPAWGEHPAYVWSKDSRTIAVHHVDRRGVRKVPFPWYLSEEPILNWLRRGAPGEVNERRSVALLDVATLKLSFLDLPDATSSRVVALAFSPKGPLLIDRQSDDCVDRVIHLADPATGGLRQIWRDRGEHRIYNEIASTWAADGERVLMTGDLDDRYRLYLLAPGEKPRLLTPGPFDVEGAAIPVAATRSIVYLSSEPDPSERHVFRIPEEGGKAEKLTAQPGLNTPIVSPDGGALALLHTDDRTPLVLQIAEGGSPPRDVTHPPQRFAGQTWARVRYASLPGPDGFPLHVRVLEPPQLAPGKKYPVLFGPVYINTVRNRFSERPLYGLLQHYLVQHGYLVVQVDMRGSTGYGREFRERFLMEWGQGDLEDLQAAVAWMKTQPQVDPARIGIFGSSYGGLLSVYSLFRKPGLFAAGVAAAPATEPRWFGSDDVAVARRPQTHPEVFARNASRYASGLRDHLLLVHGMADDVVPFKTSVDLAEELIKDGKDFDFVVSPSATHAWDKRPDTATYLLRKLVDHFDRWLGPGPR